MHLYVADGMCEVKAADAALFVSCSRDIFHVELLTWKRF
jgi:hypothetical protein